MLRDKIYNIARNTRKFVEKSPELAKILGQPVPHLGGWCGHSSILLSHNLREAGLDAKLVSGSCHWFVECQGYLVDITASQFGRGTICVRDFKKTQELITSGRMNAQWWKAFAMGGPDETNLKPTVGQMRTALKMPELWALKCKNCGHKVE